MNVKCFLIYAVSFLTVCGCAEKESALFDTPIVVEGWIESGRTPVVMVTSAIEAAEEERDISSLSDNILRYAKVSIEHDGRLYPLSARLSDEYLMRNYFTTGDIRGEVGGKYILRVEWNGKRAEAETVIPAPQAVDRLVAVRKENSDSLFTIKAGIRPDKSSGEQYFKFFTWVRNRAAGYSPSFLGTFSSALRGDYIDYTVQNGISYLQINTSNYFKLGDTVSVKLATMDEKMYDFWTGIDQNAICAVVPIVSIVSNIKGNVQGANGYWAGYGIKEDVICIR